jgi:hypothetical protein
MSNKIYVNGEWVEPVQKLKLHKLVPLKEIDRKILEKQKELKGNGQED